MKRSGPWLAILGVVLGFCLVNTVSAADIYVVDPAHTQVGFAVRHLVINQEPVLIGDLTIRGTAREVAVPFTITGQIVDPRGKTRIGFEGRLEINRKDFGVSYHKVMDNGGLVGGDTVQIELVGEAVKQARSRCLTQRGVVQIAGVDLDLVAVGVEDEQGAAFARGLPLDRATGAKLGWHKALHHLVESVLGHGKGKVQRSAALMPAGMVLDL